MVSIHERLANVQTDEGTVAGSKTITFLLRSAKLVITNDSTTKDLTVTLVTNQDITLKPTETLTIPYRANSVTLAGNNVAYRVWGFW